MNQTPRFDRWTDIAEFADVKNQNPEVLKEWKEDFNREGVAAFIENNPTFPQTQPTAQMLFDWLDSRNLPLSRANCEQTWKLLDLGTLTVVEYDDETRKPVVLHAATAAQTAPPTTTERRTLDATRDLPELNDSQRKNRDSKLHAAAIASRISHRKHHFSALIG
jgi:hypothetical protein